MRRYNENTDFFEKQISDYAVLTYAYILDQKVNIFPLI